MAGKKLLVADDSLTIQKVIRLALSSEGYDIQAVSDGNDAIQQISVFRPDAILIDVSLPGKSAFEVKRMVNAMDDLSHVRFILMSSAFEKVDEQQAESVKFDGRLTKPFDPAHLRLVLTEVLATQPSSPDLPLQPPEFNLGASVPAAAPGDEIDLSDWSQPLKPIELATPPPPPTLGGDVEESDIKRLTESTIRMSGLDDFEWTVNEPTLKPVQGMADLDGGNFSFDPPPPPTAPVSTPISHEPEMGGDGKSYFDAPSAPPQGIPANVSGNVEEMIRREVQQAMEKMAKSILPEVAERVIKQEIHRLLNDLT